MTWTHFVDPITTELDNAFNQQLHPVATNLLDNIRDFTDHVHTNLESHDTYLVGEIAIPVEDDSPDRLGTVGLRILADFDTLVTVIRTPRDIPPDFSIPDLTAIVTEASQLNLDVGEQLWFLFDRVADQLQHQLEDALDGATFLESALDSGDDPPENARQTISDLRYAFLGVHEIAEPLLEVITRIIDDDLDLRSEPGSQREELFDRSTEIRMMDVRAKLRHTDARSSYGLQVMSALSDNLKEFLAREQADAGNRMAAIASIMLLPTFVVGLYGMNIDPDSFPEMGFLNGYLFAWFLIVLVTIAQIAFFKRRRWL